MRKLDYNKIMYLVGIILMAVFIVSIIIDHLNYESSNSAPFYVYIIVRTLEFFLPGVLLIYLYNQNTSIKESNYSVKNFKITEKFNGYKIAHISDFHNTNSKRIKKNIIKMLEQNNPDVIVITGDLIDSRRTNIATAKEFLQSIIHVAPIYYVLGNHESRILDLKTLIQETETIGVKVLRNITVEIEKQGECIEIVGLDDPSFLTTVEKEIKEKIDIALDKILKDSKNFRIMLIHRPELAETYSKYKLDLVFTGHAHGGQIRLPIVGGIIAPGQGWFPKYTKGPYKINNTEMVVSRGIGNSAFPFRVNNRPEIVFVTLKSENNK